MVCDGYQAGTETVALSLRPFYLLKSCSSSFLAGLAGMVASTRISKLTMLRRMPAYANTAISLHTINRIAIQWRAAI